MKEGEIYYANETGLFGGDFWILKGDALLFIKLFNGSKPEPCGFVNYPARYTFCHMPTRRNVEMHTATVQNYFMDAFVKQAEAEAKYNGPVVVNYVVDEFGTHGGL